MLHISYLDRFLARKILDIVIGQKCHIGASLVKNTLLDCEHSPPHICGLIKKMKDEPVPSESYLYLFHILFYSLNAKCIKYIYLTHLHTIYPK